MGSDETATRRLNLAQAFNPIGSLCGMFVAMKFIQAKLNPLSTAERANLTDAQFEAVKQADLAVLSRPYILIAAVIIVLFVLLILAKVPDSRSVQDDSTKFGPTVKRLWNNRKYRFGVIAQFFYVGVQIMCWTFIIQYGTRVFMNEGMPERDAEVLSQTYNIVAMAIFCLSRFICTFLLKFTNPSKLLGALAVAGGLFTCGVIFIDGRLGMYCLVAVSACMSLMFPTIYGLALGGLGEDAKLGAAGLIMAILGGSVLPPLQASIIDRGTLFGMPAVNVSFILPFFCFVVIVLYAVFVFKLTKNTPPKVTEVEAN
jgi:FHS family L-fucose permease-like MFS transporter